MPLDLSAVDLTTEVIRTARLVLRPPRREDEDAVHRACQDREVLRWTAGLPDPYTHSPRWATRRHRLWPVGRDSPPKASGRAAS